MKTGVVVGMLWFGSALLLGVFGGFVAGWAGSGGEAPAEFPLQGQVEDLHGIFREQSKTLDALRSDVQRWARMGEQLADLERQVEAIREEWRRFESQTAVSRQDGIPGTGDPERLKEEARTVMDQEKKERFLTGPIQDPRVFFEVTGEDVLRWISEDLAMSEEQAENLQKMVVDWYRENSEEEARIRREVFGPEMPEDWRGDPRAEIYARRYADYQRESHQRFDDRMERILGPEQHRKYIESAWGKKDPWNVYLRWRGHLTRVGQGGESK